MWLFIGTEIIRAVIWASFLCVTPSYPSVYQNISMSTDFPSMLGWRCISSGKLHRRCCLFVVHDCYKQSGVQERCLSVTYYKHGAFACPPLNQISECVVVYQVRDARIIN